MPLLSLITANTCWVLLCIALASYVQNLTGFAFGLIFLALVGVFDLIQMEVAANAVTFITLIQTFIYFREYPLTDDWQVIRPAIWPSLAGVVAGLAFLFWLSDSALYLLKIALGFSVVGAAGLLVMRFEPKSQLDPPGSFALTGLLAGLMGGLFSTAGPPLVYKLYRQPLSLPVIRQALLLMFGLSQLVRLVIVLIIGQFTLAAAVYALLALPLLLGVTLGNRRYPLKLSPTAVSRIAAGLLLMAGVSLIATAWSSSSSR
jgi:hypothetical protein